MMGVGRDGHTSRMASSCTAYNSDMKWSTTARSLPQRLVPLVAKRVAVSFATRASWAALSLAFTTASSWPNGLVPRGLCLAPA